MSDRKYRNAEFAAIVESLGHDRGLACQWLDEMTNQRNFDTRVWDTEKELIYDNNQMFEYDRGRYGKRTEHNIRLKDTIIGRISFCRVGFLENVYY